ncbi:MAG: hydrogen gas-evolving membrane-bound hydrogenase subunit E [Actinomycetota bacterium]
MTVVLAVHVLAAAAAGALGSRLGAKVFLLAGIAPASTVIWILGNGGDILDGNAVTESYRWVPGLDLELSFRVDSLSLLMLGLVGGIGVLVFVYASRYFHGDEPGLPRFAAILTIFAGAMTGLVSADDLIAVFMFWELTSITSYGLIGFNDRSAKARASAVQALLITGSGGLALLAGLILVQITSGVTSFSDLAGIEIEGGVATGAAILVLYGAFTKSAQAPFHGWLPGAMAAPTPVSAYLHSATMVKAGVFLVARMSPVFHQVDTWIFLTVGVGVGTMLWGGYRALRQTDLKLILAYGTVSQLGMLVATFGVGKDKLYTAGVAMLLAHALFKAALFMVVGIIDHSTHTRDIRELSGLGRRMPVLTAATVVAGLSMAGMIPLFGYVAKETVLAGLLEADFFLVDLATAGVVAGSCLTAAYTLRFLWGAFWDKPGVDDTELHRPDPVFVGPTVLLAVPTIVFGLVPSLAEELVHPAASNLDAAATETALKLWPGFILALYLSAFALVVGGVLFAARSTVEAFQERLGRSHDAAGIFQHLLAASLRGAAKVTRVVQTGSLPLYLGVIIMTTVSLPAIAIGADAAWPDDLVAADSWLQGVVVVGTMAAAAAVTVASRRFSAVLMFGAVGFGIAGLFVIQGAPDLALTMALVETVVIAMYVLVLRHLPERFSPTPFNSVRILRLGIAGLVGVSVLLIMVTATAERTEVPVDAEIATRSVPEGDGSNVVNVTLVDFRGFDTLGEIVVLVVAAVGVAALVRTGRRRSTDQGEAVAGDDPPDPEPGPDPAREVTHA